MLMSLESFFSFRNISCVPENYLKIFNTYNGKLEIELISWNFSILYILALKILSQIIETSSFNLAASVRTLKCIFVATFNKVKSAKVIGVVFDSSSEMEVLSFIVFSVPLLCSFYHLITSSSFLFCIFAAVHFVRAFIIVLSKKLSIACVLIWLLLLFAQFSLSVLESARFAVLFTSVGRINS